MSTPSAGPWRVNDDSAPGGAGLVIWSDAGGVVALLPTTQLDDGRRIGNRANADLIASAPEQQAKIEALAEALKDALAFVPATSECAHRAVDALRLAGRL